MHLKDLIKTALILAVIIAVIVFALGKLDKAAHDNTDPVLEGRSEAVDTIENT